MTGPTSTLGQKMRAARLARRLTQEQLAGREFTKSYISELERGNRTPRLLTLKLLARRLGLPLSHFLDGATGDRESEALLTVGLAYLHSDSLSEAARWLNRALELTAADGDELTQARVELALACVDQQLGHGLRAWRRAERVLRSLGQNGDRETLARAHLCLGRSKLETGDTASAAWTFEAALQLISSQDNPSLAAALHYYLGLARERQGEAGDAAGSFETALELAGAFADPRRRSEWHTEHAAAAAAEGAFDSAIAHAEEAAAVYEMLGHKRRLGDIHWRLGDLDARAGHWPEAQRHYLTSIAMHGAAGHARGAAQTLGCLVEALLSRVPPDAARAIGEVALALFPEDHPESIGHRADRAATLWLRGTVKRVVGRLEEARAALTESLGLFEAQRQSTEARGVRRELALLALEANDVAAARQHLNVLRETPELSAAPATL